MKRLGQILLIYILGLVIATGSTVHARPEQGYVTEQTSALDSRAAVVIELEDPAAAILYADLRAGERATSAQIGAATRTHIVALEQAQAQTIAELAQIDVAPLFTLQRVYNGIAARVPLSEIARIERMNGVKAVHSLVAQWPMHTISMPHIGAPELWQGTAGAGYTGKGVTIGVIDTGVDYLHTDFGGSGAGYAVNDPTTIGDVPDYPGVKVIGGYDFAGENYDADPESPFFQPDPTPDADPADCHGHGTHVAGTAAGFGVSADGATYPGPYDGQIDPTGLSIGPGVAPHADIYALKVFGCSGSTELTALAIEWAVDPDGDGDLSDHLDVINLSLGSPYGSAYDASAVAADNAALVGVIVVASAGNSGDTYYVTGSPGTARRAVSVAAMVDRTTEFGGEPIPSSYNTLAAFSSRGPRLGDGVLKPDLGAPGLRVFSAAAGSGDRGKESSGTSMAAPHVAGGMALLRQHSPTWRVDELKARIMNTSDRAVRAGAVIDAPLHGPTRVGSGAIDLPAALATDVIAYNAKQPEAVSLSFGSPQVLSEYFAVQRVRVRNKGNETHRFQVDYSARIDTPGVDFETPLGETVELAPGQAGDLAIGLRASAAAMLHTLDNTMEPIQGAARHWLAEEAGYLTLWPAPAIFHAAPGGSAVNPPVETEGSASAVTIYSPATGILSFTVGVTVSSNIEAITLWRGLPGTDGHLIESIYPTDSVPSTAGTASIVGSVALAEPDEMLLASGGLYIRVDTATYPEGELQGALAGVKPVLNVPLYAAPRPASLLTSNAELTFGPDEQRRQSLAFRGVGLSGSNPPTDVVSLASLFELHFASPPLSGKDGGAQEQSWGPADIQYVGVASDYGQVEMVAGSTIYFGLSTYGKRSTPAEVTFNILIDVDGNGEDDFRVFTSDEYNFVNRFKHSDAFNVVVEDLKEGGFIAREPLNALSPAQIGTGLFESNVLVLPVGAAALGMDEEQPAIHYRVNTSFPGSGEIVDSSPRQAFSLNGAAIRPQYTGDYKPYFVVDDGATIAVELGGKQNELKRDGKILTIQPQNDAAERVQIVDYSFRWPYNSFFPLLVIE